MKTERRIRRKTVNETNAATERATASVDETMEPIEASEERNAAMETEGMSGPAQGLNHGWRTRQVSRFTERVRIVA